MDKRLKEQVEKRYGHLFVKESKASNWLFFLGFGLLGVVLIVAFVSWEVFKYEDCLRVGHSKGYCTGKIFFR